MKKVVLILFSVFTLLFILYIPSTAAKSESDVLKNIDSATKEYLEDLGIDTESGEGISDISLKTVFKFLISLVTDKTKRVSGFLIIVIAVIIIDSILSSFIEENASAKTAVNYISVICIITAIIVPLKELIINAGAVIKTAAIFTDSYVPILGAIIAASGNVKLAFTYNSFAIALSAFIAEVADKFFIPVVNMLFAFNILTSFTFESYKHKIIKSVKRLIIIILSLISTIYTGLLTTQSILAVSSDSLTVRGIRFFSGTFIPVVGSGVSESVASVMSSLSVMKNTAGVVVIVIIILIFLPVIIELLVWYFALSFCSITADLFGNNEVSEMIEELSSVISLINIILFYITFVLIISTGIIIVSGK
ncbi:MAG: hypothetical protein J1F24_00865 [Oscillospiraceae bacterium]|nr:hypothetical protein [Oscillospiraceae bacterium]